MTLTAKADRLPPCLLRLLAKKDGKLMSDEQLMKQTGWKKGKLKSIYRRATFARVPIEDVDIFFAACGLSPSSQNRKRWLVKLALERGGLEGIAGMYHLRGRAGWRNHQVKTHLKRFERLILKK